MERGRIIPLIYGYLVCLAAIITVLISVGNFVKAGFWLFDPIRAEDFSFSGAGRDLTSPIAYKQSMLLFPPGTATQTAGSLSEE